MIRDQIADIFARAVASLQEAGSLPAVEMPPIDVTRPQIAEHGDYATNIAMKLAAAAQGDGREGQSPRAGRADRRARSARRPSSCPPTISSAPSRWPAPASSTCGSSPRGCSRRRPDRRRGRRRFGAIHVGPGQRVNLEFVSANPTGPVTVGNGRGAFIGDTLGNVMRAADFDVTKEYYFNDAGEQIIKLGRSMEYYLYLALGEKEKAEQAYERIPVARKFTRDKDFYKKDTASPTTTTDEDEGERSARRSPGERGHRICRDRG